MCPFMRAHWHRRANTRLNLCFLWPTRVHNPNGKLISSAIFATSRHSVDRHVLSPNNCPFTWGIWVPSNTCFLGPIRAHNPKSNSISSAIFAQMTTECPYTLQLSHPQNCPFIWGSGLLSNTCFPAPTRVLNPNSISISSAVFAGLTSVTDRLPCSVCNNRPHLHM